MTAGFCIAQTSLRVRLENEVLQMQVLQRLSSLRRIRWPVLRQDFQLRQFRRRKTLPPEKLQETFRFRLLRRCRSKLRWVLTSRTKCCNPRSLDGERDAERRTTVLSLGES